MGLWQKAVETYDKHASLVGATDAQRDPLLPVSHIIQNAQIEIHLDSEGNFLSAKSVADGKHGTTDDRKTIIPATLESANRTAAPCAHPLSDQLGYVAPTFPDRHALYLEALRAWADSADTHPKLKAVLAYVKKGTILQDLESEGVLKPDADGNLKDADYKLLVRWCVASESGKEACFEDTTLFDAFIRYNASLSKDKEKQLCMISGNQDYMAEAHPKGVLTMNYGAKLISANDSANFTYRGRFSQPAQASSVGYEASQKAHSALTWICSNQGVNVDGRVFVCWNPSGKTVPFRSCGLLSVKKDAVKRVTPSDYQADLKKTLAGWKAELPDTEDVVLASFEAATTGRLSVTYYNELQGSDFLERIAFWQTHCVWENGDFGFQSPSVFEIVSCAYGTERGADGDSARLETDPKLRREQVGRLFHAVFDRAPIPKDVVHRLFCRASHPQAFRSRNNRQKLLFTACAVIYAYRTVTKKEEWNMSLDKEKKDRSYQFGRLLAVLEAAERATYDRGEDREPNAVRMQSVFCKRPMYAASIIRERLIPYFKKMKPGLRSYYNDLIGEILEKIDFFPESEHNRPLEDSYLMGYYLQKREMYRKKSSDEPETENDGMTEAFTAEATPDENN